MGERTAVIVAATAAAAANEPGRAGEWSGGVVGGKGERKEDDDGRGQVGWRARLFPFPAISQLWVKKLLGSRQITVHAHVQDFLKNALSASRYIPVSTRYGPHTPLSRDKKYVPPKLDSHHYRE